MPLSTAASPATGCRSCPSRCSAGSTCRAASLSARARSPPSGSRRGVAVIWGWASPSCLPAAPGADHRRRCGAGRDADQLFDRLRRRRRAGAAVDGPPPRSTRRSLLEETPSPSAGGEWAAGGGLERSRASVDRWRRTSCPPRPSNAAAIASTWSGAASRMTADEPWGTSARTSSKSASWSSGTLAWATPRRCLRPRPHGEPGRPEEHAGDAPVRAPSAVFLPIGSSWSSTST